jgi:hypothetical protein
MADTSEKSEPLLICLIPNLVGGEGHIIPYHQSVGQATKHLGWEHQVAVARDPTIKNLPDRWSFSFNNYDLESESNIIKKIFRIKSAFDLGIDIANYLREDVIARSRFKIIFLERFIHLQLLSLLIALLLIPKKEFVVWLLYRRDVHKDRTRFIYKLLNHLIKKLLGSDRFKLLTDSELLSHSLSSYFNQPVIVMPIPHTDFICCDRSTEKVAEIVCWWPGPPRLEKGWETIKALGNVQFDKNALFCLVAAESSELVPKSGGIKIQRVKNNLTRLEYSQYLNICDFILLPYNSDAYRERTSGIFTECIIAGKIPVVTSNTWMAKELYNYGLESLILDWEEPEIVWNKILEISQDLIIKKQIDQMQSDYRKFHGIEKYAAKMQQLLQAY